MKVFISVDMEGITGITDPDEILAGGADYPRGRVAMTEDTNAAIAGAFDGGATEVLVNDSHWSMRNLLIEKLDPRARLIQGAMKPLSMLQGVDESFSAAVFIGYHAMAGTPAAVLAHTMLGKEIHNVYLDGERMGEIKINSLLAGHFGVPVAFISGDTACCVEARRLLGDDLPAFAVKDGIDMFAAACLGREETYKGIRSGVAKAVSAASLERRHPYKLPGAHRYAIEWNTTTIAAMCALIPGMKRMDSRTTEYATDDVTEAMSVFIAEYTIAMQVGQRGVYG